MKINYRPIENADEKAVTQFMKALYKQDYFGKFVSDQKIINTLEELKKYPEKGVIMIIEADGLLVGYSILINFWSNEYGGNILDVDEIYIRPEYRGKGIGKSFIQYLLEVRFNNLVAIQLETLKTNERAKSFYKSIGFRASESDHFILEVD